MASRKRAPVQTHKPSYNQGLALGVWRDKKGVSLAQITERTKISTHFLRAIEAEEFEKLPGGIFNTSYLRQYAQAIQYDETELLDYYEQRMNAPAPAAPERDEPGQSDSRSFFVRLLRTNPQTQH